MSENQAAKYWPRPIKIVNSIFSVTGDIEKVKNIFYPSMRVLITASLFSPLMAIGGGATISEKDAAKYDEAAVCDFIAARLFDANGRISEQAGGKPAIIEIEPGPNSSLRVFRYKNTDIMIDYFLLGSEKKIVAAHFYQNAMYKSDLKEGHLLSRLGVAGNAKASIFSAWCDSTKLEIEFKNEIFQRASIFARNE